MADMNEKSTDMVKAEIKHYPEPHPRMYPIPPPGFSSNPFSLPINHGPAMGYALNQMPGAAMGYGLNQMPGTAMGMVQNQFTQGSSSQEHRCARCGRLRSAKYHHTHPIFPGQIPKKSMCRECRENDSDSEDVSLLIERRPVEPVRERIREYHKDRGARRVTYAPLPSQHRVARSSSLEDAHASSVTRSQERYRRRYSPQVPSAQLQDLQIQDPAEQHSNYHQARRGKSMATPKTEYQSRRRRRSSLEDVGRERVQELEGSVDESTSGHGRDPMVTSLQVRRNDGREGRPTDMRPRVRNPQQSYNRTRETESWADEDFGERGEQRYTTRGERSKRWHSARKTQLLNVEHHASETESEDLQTDLFQYPIDVDEEAQLRPQHMRARSQSGHQHGPKRSRSHRPASPHWTPRERFQRMLHAPSPPMRYHSSSLEYVDRMSDVETASQNTEHQRRGFGSRNRAPRGSQLREDEESEVEVVPASTILRPGDRVTIVETHHTAPLEEYDWYDQNGRRSRVKEI